jgi:pyrimidine-nucleoside phosphorylase
MTILDIIEKKKNKQTLTEEEIIFFINGYTKTKEITDYQASAFLMAMFINGFNSKETYFLTKAMLHSGIVVDLSNIKGTKIDKHSTGGVGDKVSLILAPICAALGIKVPKMSGKGLGHTGGTIDKLESIGVKCELDKKEYLTLLKQNGLFIVSQTDDIVPADKLIYKLRNATATVDCVPLMASSIVSKKLALKTDYVFLDVKVGDGGFNKTLDDAIKLSKVMLNIFKQFKRKAIIHITDMSQPLGRAIGNAIEVKESIDFLNGKFNSLDLKTLIFDFVVDILLETKKAKSKQEAINLITQIIESKKAIKCFLD